MPAAGLAQTKCAADDPALAAKSFYKLHENFDHEDPATFKNLVTPRVFAALARDYKCADGEICAQDTVPWTDAQDGEIRDPIKFDVITASAAQASVKMSYTFELSKQQRRRMSVTLKFQRASAQSCWLLSDFILPNGTSRISQIEDWHKKFGTAR